jgi:hypothetical protein
MLRQECPKKPGVVVHNYNPSYLRKNIVFIGFSLWCVFVVSEFELRASQLFGRHTTT